MAELQADRKAQAATEPNGLSPAPRDRVIFILGILPRSGTNFLHRLICLHPDCGAVNKTPVREDYLLHHAERLKGYLDRLRWQWGHWGADAPLMQALSQHVGAGLAAFLHTLTQAERVVTKTPSVRNVGLTFDLFRNAHLLIIVRDGRSVVESGMSGFEWDFETAARRWAQAVREVLAFQQAHDPPAQRCLVVKYEQLSTDTYQELQRVLDFLGLDADRYDFAAALDLPVYGSSFVQKEAAGMSWQPVEKPAAFDASKRWRHWGRFRHERFNWLAGRELQALGYAPQTGGGLRWPWVVLNRSLDGFYHVKRLPGRLFRSAKEAAKAFLKGMSDSL